MTDRELLEMAAKAIGLKGWKWSDERGEILYSKEGYSPFLGGSPTSFAMEPWNPLTDEGDAMRLAVKLKMRVNIAGAMTAIVYYTEVGADGLTELFGDDPAAATRRAIVCAAAEIGKRMP